MEQNQVKPIPEGYHSLTPYLIVKDCAKAIEWYQRAFGACEHFHLEAASGKIGHAELQIGDSRFMLADEFPDMGETAPQGKEHSLSLLLYVENADEFFDRAVDHGAIIIHPLKDQFYGDRMGTLQDPFGHRWNVATHIEDVSSAEIEKRARSMFS